MVPAGVAAVTKRKRLRAWRGEAAYILLDLTVSMALMKVKLLQIFGVSLSLSLSHVFIWMDF